MMTPRLNIHYSLKDFYILVKSLFTSRSINCINDNLFYVNRSRTALRIALSALNLEKGAGIAVMVYNCHTVFNAIRLAGYTPVFIDVTNDFTIDLQDLEKKREQVSACLITHLFGYISNIEKVKQICTKIPIIEDCAHAYLSEYKGKYAGDFGDISTFSIGHAKFPSVGDGGYVKVNNNHYLEEVRKEYEKCEYPSFMAELKSVFNTFLLNCLYNRVVFKHITYHLVKGKPMTNVLVDESEHRICNTVFRLYLLKVKESESLKLEQNENKTELVKNLRLYFANIYLPNALLNGSYNDFMLPALTANRNEVIDFFHNKGVELGTHFSKSIQWATQFGYIKNDCKNAEKISNQIVVFPTYYKYIKLILNENNL